MEEKDGINKVWEIISRFKTLGIIISIVIVLLGICMFIRPFKTEMVMMTILLVTALINGIEKVFIYFKTRKEFRDGWQLAIGILWIAASLILLTDVMAATFFASTFIGCMIGFSVIFSGVGDFVNSAHAEEMGRSKGMMIFAGILSVICGVIILSAPFVGTVTIYSIYGMFLIILGVTLFIRCLSIKKPE